MIPNSDLAPEPADCYNQGMAGYALVEAPPAGPDLAALHEALAALPLTEDVGLLAQAALDVACRLFGAAAAVLTESSGEGAGVVRAALGLPALLPQALTSADLA